MVSQVSKKEGETKDKTSGVHTGMLDQTIPSTVLDDKRKPDAKRINRHGNTKMYTRAEQAFEIEGGGREGNEQKKQKKAVLEGDFLHDRQDRSRHGRQRSQGSGCFVCRAAKGGYATSIHNCEPTSPRGTLPFTLSPSATPAPPSPPPRMPQSEKQ